MKQSEKSAKSKKFILDAAAESFSKYGLDGLTLNAFCEEYGISKGQFYHYFKSKRHLYDECLKDCVSLFVDYMTKNVSADGDFHAAIHSYIRARGEFWSCYPVCERLTILAIVSESEDEAVAKILKPLNDYNREVFHKIIKNNKLKCGMTEEKANIYLEMTQEMSHVYLIKNGFRAQNKEDTRSFQELVKDLLEILMNGIFEQK